MLFASYARMQSIRNPKLYTRELVMRRPAFTMVALWLFGLAIWAPLTFTFGLTPPYTNQVNVQPQVVSPIVNTITWFLPLVGICAMSVHTFYLLVERERIKAKFRNSRVHHNIRELHQRRNTLHASLQLSRRPTPSLAEPDTIVSELNVPALSFTVNNPNHLTLITRYKSTFDGKSLQAKTRFLLIMGPFCIQW